MRVLKNIQFTDLIKVGGTLREFNFRKSNGKTDTPFEVDVIDYRGHRHHFMMEQHNGDWMIVKAEVPQWIMELEQQLCNSIRENMNGFEIYVPTSHQQPRHQWQVSKWMQLLRMG